MNDPEDPDASPVVRRPARRDPEAASLDDRDADADGNGAERAVDARARAPQPIHRPAPARGPDATAGGWTAPISGPVGSTGLGANGAPGSRGDRGVDLERSRTAVFDYLRVLRRQWWVVALVTALAVAAAVAYTQTATPVYSSSMKIVVGQGQSLFSAQSSGAFQPFTQTMTDLLQSNVVAQRAIRAERLSLTSQQLLDRLSVTSNPDTSVLRVSYDDTDRQRSARVLRTIGQRFIELVNTRLGRRTTSPTQGLTDVPTPGQLAAVSATIFDPAHPDPGQVSPHVKRTIAIALVLGLVGGVLLAFFRDSLSNRLRSEAEASEAFGSPVLAQLPRGLVGTKPSQIPLLPAKMSAQFSEAIQLLVATLRFSSEHQERGVILVTSARPEDGKSTVAAQVAAGLARAGRSVIAVEADMHRPSLHRLLDVEPGLVGLTDVLADRAETSATLVDVPLTDSPAEIATRGLLELLPAGRREMQSSELLSVGSASELVAGLRDLSDYVVIDTPPILLSGDSFPLVQVADLVVIVCREDHTSREEAQATRARLESLGVGRFSVVLTESSVAQRSYGYAYAG